MSQSHGRDVSTFKGLHQSELDIQELCVGVAHAATFVLSLGFSTDPQFCELPKLHDP